MSTAAKEKPDADGTDAGQETCLADSTALAAAGQAGLSTPTLVDLAQRINQEHRACVRAMSKGLAPHSPSAAEYGQVSREA